MISYIELRQALAVIDHFGFQVRDVGLLASALARPSATVLGEDAYATLPLKAAALISSLSQNHSLIDGNKRLALVLTGVFLDINAHHLTFTNDEIFDLVMAVSQSELELDEIAEVIAAHMRRREL